MSTSPFSAAHRRYVKSLYKRMLENERNWVVRYDLFRARACAVRAEFERNRYVLSNVPLSVLPFSERVSTQRNVHDPRALAVILEKAEEELARKRHPDPYIRAFLKTFLAPPASAHLYDDTYLRQIQRSLAVQNGGSIVPRASWGILFTHPLLLLLSLGWEHLGSVICLYVLSNYLIIF